MIRFAMAVILASVLTIPRLSPRLAQGRGSSMVDLRQLCRPCRPTRLFMAAVAYLHDSAGTVRTGAWPCSRRVAGIASEAAACGSMRDVFDIYTIIFLALAVFIFLRLRSVLGQRTGRERPPYDPYSSAPRYASGRRRATRSWRCRAARPTPRKAGRAGRAAADRWKGVAEPGSALATGLDAIAREDKSFDAKHFIVGARAAYEMIVTAYAGGDRRQLKNLLAARSMTASRPPSRSASSAARRSRRVSSRSTAPTSPPPRCVARPRR